LSLSTAEPEREVAHAPAAPASARAAPWAAWLVLAAILAGGLALRLYNNGHGLPFVFHPDEADHFTNRALNMIAAGTLDPVYLQNPSGFTEVMYAVLRLGFGGNPYHVGRVVAALLALLGVAAVYGAGRRLWGRAEGLAAAAVLSFAFLPVAYSRYALTDVGTFVGVALAAYGIVRVREDGALRYYLLAGAASGLAIGFKYTAGVIVVPLVLAGFRDRRRLAAGLGATVVAFFITTPYFFIHLHGALYQL
jgi:predicted membrane-bound mannosyltransferase